MLKLETRQDAETLVCESETETKTCKTSQQNKWNINETLRLFAKVYIKISRSHEKFTSAKILAGPFTTPY